MTTALWIIGLVALGLGLHLSLKHLPSYQCPNCRRYLQAKDAQLFETKIEPGKQVEVATCPSCKWQWKTGDPE